MNARSAWFFFDDAFIFKLGRVPIPLHLECFGVQLVGRYGLRGRTAELLGRNSREIGISMDQDKKHFRIPGKLSAEQPDKVEGRVSIIQIQRTT